ncbi:transglutaminase family protein, partial [Mesorhizobium sp. M7A.F.Ca.CA.001.13.2.1]
MLIRLGYEIAIECVAATPVISVLEIHRDRQADIKRQTRVLTSPAVPTRLY